jgi:thiamine-phosphate pyrophosphorylase
MPQAHNTRHEQLHGLYVITDTHLITRGRFAATVEAAISNGARIVQLREKDAPPEEVARLGRELIAVTRRYGAVLLINDYPEVARDIGADGVHVGREDTSVAAARMLLGPQAIIGASCYGDIDLAVAAEHAGADYVAFGTPFPSVTKPPTSAQRPERSLDIFRQAKQRVTIPVFAISGITLANAPQVVAARADGIAVVSAVFGAPDVGAAARALAALFA